MKSSHDLPEINWPPGISENQKDVLRQLLHAYVGAVNDFKSDPSVIFPSEEDRQRLFHASLNKWRKKRMTPAPCMHPGCTSKSIKRSHTISMSGSIKEIAENGHVVTPRFGKNGVELVSIGVRDASTFPGFCDLHEAEFHEFESKKQLTTPDHFFLQAFRTICREIYTQTHHKEKLEAGLDDYRRLRETFIRTRLRQVSGSETIDVKSVKFGNDPLEDQVVEQIPLLSKNLVELNGLYHGLLDDFQNGADKIYMFATTFDLQLPVCLSGVGVLPHNHNGTIDGALCFLAIIPEATETKIIIGAAQRHKKAIRVYFQDNGSLALLERLESWMCHGSDHWFMRPSDWDSIPQARKDALCETILDGTPSIADPVPFSILDAARNEILASGAQQVRDGAFAGAELDRVRELFAEQRAKLNWAPPSSASS